MMQKSKRAHVPPRALQPRLSLSARLGLPPAPAGHAAAPGAGAVSRCLLPVAHAAPPSVSQRVRSSVLGATSLRACRMVSNSRPPSEMTRAGMPMASATCSSVSSGSRRTALLGRLEESVLLTAHSGTTSRSIRCRSLPRVTVTRGQQAAVRIGGRRGAAQVPEYPAALAGRLGLFRQAIS